MATLADLHAPPLKPIELWRGDCLELMAHIPRGSVNMVIADLPYAHFEGQKVRRCTANPWDTPINIRALWDSMLDATADTCTYAMTATQPFASLLVREAVALFKYDLIWDKPKSVGFLNANRRPLRSHEHVLIFQRGKPPYFAQKTPGKPFKERKKGASNNYGKDVFTTVPANPSGLRHPRSIIPMPHDGGGRYHPTAKPVALMEWLIKTYSIPGDTVLDPTMGSGTTCVAAHNLGRRAIGIEKDDEYFRVAVKRVNEAMATP